MKRHGTCWQIGKVGIAVVYELSHVAKRVIVFSRYERHFASCLRNEGFQEVLIWPQVRNFFVTGSHIFTFCCRILLQL